MRVILFSLQCVEMADIVKNFGALQHRRTGKHMENPLCIGPPKVLPYLIFLALEISHTGAPYGNFFARQTATVSVLLVMDRRPVDFLISGVGNRGLPSLDGAFVRFH